MSSSRSLVWTSSKFDPKLEVSVKRKVAGFTLAEAMMAMLFISIAFFAYISLHMRIIHSNSKLEGRQAIKERVASDIAVKLAQSRSGQTTKAGLSDTTLALPGAPSSGNVATAGNSTGSSSSTSFPEFQAYSNTANSTRSTAYDNGGYQSSTAYNQSTSVDKADWGKAASGGDSSVSIRYEEGEATQNPTGLPPNLNLVETKVNFRDRNGEHTYYVDCYQRVELVRW